MQDLQTGQVTNKAYGGQSTDVLTLSATYCPLSLVHQIEMSWCDFNGTQDWKLTSGIVSLMLSSQQHPTT